MCKDLKKKVLIVHNYYQIPGGEDTVVHNEKKLLEQHGHKVYLYTRHNNELTTLGVFGKIILLFSCIFNLRTFKDIKKIIRDEHIDVVHVHNTLPLISTSVYYAAIKCNVPVIQTIHNFRFLCPAATFYRSGHICEDCLKKGLHCSILHRCYRNSFLQTFVCVLNTWIHRHTGILKKVYFICLTDFTKNKLILLKNIEPRKVFVKPNFTFGFDDKSEKKQSKSGTRNFFLYIGRLEEIKGVDILIEAFNCMPDKELHIAGCGLNDYYYKKKAADNIKFLGFLNRQELSDQLYHSTAVIVPSQCYETFGMSIIESYSKCVPVIVGDIGNISKLVDDGITGLKFKYDDIDSLINCINSVGVIRRENCYKKFLNDFSPESNYKFLISIYDDIHDR